MRPEHEARRKIIREWTSLPKERGIVNRPKDGLGVPLREMS
jgi:hypothetical protein